MLPSYTYLPEIFLHLYHTTILYNLDLISISFDVLNSKKEKGRKSLMSKEPIYHNMQQRNGKVGSRKLKLTGLSALRYQGKVSVWERLV
jgi:hypothetical protein